ncbi:MAG: TraB/GumN family protein [Flavobacteriales bacterium]
MKLILLLFSLFCSCYLAFGQNYVADKELLWEISGNGLKTKSYVFGSLHSNDKRLFQLADSVYTALNQSQKIILETDIFGLFDDLDTRKKLPNTLYDKNGNPYTAETEAGETFYGDEDGMPQFLDAYFQQYCYNAGKEFIALESIKEQYDLLSDEIQVSDKQYIDNALNNFTHEHLIDLYLKGDLMAIDKFMKANMSIQENLYDEVIIKRNIKMAQKLDSILKAKTSFFCAVGAGHLGGSNGILTILRSKGYKVRMVTWSHHEKPSKDELMVRSAKEYVFRDESAAFVAKLPGKPIVTHEADNVTHIIYRELGQGNTYEISIIPMDSSISQEEIAASYIATPPNTSMRKLLLDDGRIIFEGLSNTYPEGLNFVQVQFSPDYFAVIKTYGGNKFMHSNRPNQFFLRVWFE